MRREYLLLRIFLIGVLLGAFAAMAPDCGRSNEVVGLIYNGEKSTSGDWPWIVALFYRPANSFFCSGSLVSEKHLLSGEYIIIAVQFKILL